MLHLYKNKIAINKEALPDIPEVKQLVDSLKEEDALKVLMYIYLTVSRDDENPLKDFPESERVRLASKIALGDMHNSLSKMFPKDIKTINTAIKSYENLVVDKIQKDIDLYDKKMYQFIQLLDKNEPEIIKNIHEISSRVTFSTNIDIVTLVLDNSIELILEKASLISLKQTGKLGHALRGGLSLKKKVNKLIRKVNDDTSQESD